MEFISDKEYSLKDFLVDKGFSRKYIRRNKEKFLVNNKSLKLHEKINIGDVISINTDEDSEINIVDYPLNILYEDNDILIVYKEKGIPVIGTIRHYEFHLSGMILNYYKKNNINNTVHLVNRLDKDTEGIVIIAKNGYVKNLMKNTKIIKRYFALVEGIFDEEGYHIFKISKDENSNKRFISKEGSECFTYYKTKSIDHKNNTSLMDILLITGRTHQIRVCFKGLNHPLVGDVIYNDKYSENELFYLKNYKVEFIHPITKENVIIEV